MSKMRLTHSFELAQAILNVAESEVDDLASLAKSAGLDPLRGDLSHIDLHDASIAGEDLSGWNLQFANFDGCNVAGTNLRGANLNAEQLIEAVSWRSAKLDDSLRSEAATLEANQALNSPAFQFFAEATNFKISKQILNALSSLGSRGRRKHPIRLREFLEMIDADKYFLSDLGKPGLLALDKEVWYEGAEKLIELSDLPDKTLSELLKRSGEKLKFYNLTFKYGGGREGTQKLETFRERRHKGVRGRKR